VQAGKAQKEKSNKKEKKVAKGETENGGGE